MKCRNCQNEIANDVAFCPHCGKRQLIEAASTGYEYAAFISYRHLPHDQEVAKQVQKAIEAFKMPKDFAATGKEGGRIGKCFRDEDELAASHSLPERILAALENSSSLVVVCTPATKDSIWVQREIEAFIEMHGRERVFPVLADGSSSESIPEILCIQEADGTHSSPLASDLRPDATTKPKDEILRIIAAIAGCDYDDLKRREQTRKRKHTAIASAIAIIVAIAIGFAAYASRQALIIESHQLAAESRQLLAQGDRYGAIQKALAALPSSNSLFGRPVVDDARDALIDALQIDPDENLFWRQSYLITLDNDLFRFIAEPSRGWFAVLDSSITLTTYDCITGKKLQSIPLLDYVTDDEYIDIDSAPLSWYMVPAKDNIALIQCAGTGKNMCFNAKTGELVWEFNPLPMRAISTSFDGERIDEIFVYENTLVDIGIGSQNKERLNGAQVNYSDDLISSRTFLPIASNDENKTFIGIGNLAICLDTSDNGEPPSVEAKDYDICSLDLIEDSVLIATYNERDGEIWDYRFERLGPSMQTLWADEGSWELSAEGNGLDLHAVSTRPVVYGAAFFDKEYACCSVGDTLLLYDIDNGETVYSEHFGSPIVSVGIFGDSIKKDHADTLAIALASGKIHFRSPFLEPQATNLKRMSFSFPSLILTFSIGWVDENNAIALAPSLDDPRKLYAFRLDMSVVREDAERKSAKLSLDSLINYAHTVLSDAGYE